MSKRDEQLDNELKQMLGDVDIPSPGADARKRAIAMAREEYESVQEEVRKQSRERKPKIVQGVIDWLRLIVGSNTDNRSTIMAYNQKFVYGGITAVAVGAIAVGIALQYQHYSTSPLSVVGRESAFGYAFSDGKERAQVASKEDLRKRQVHTLEEVVVTSARNTVVLHEAVELDTPRPVITELALAPDMRQRRNDEKAKTAYARHRDTSVQESSIRLGAVASNAAKNPAVAAVMPPSADSDVMLRPIYEDVGRDTFEEFEQNQVKLVAEEPVSTFSVDVDTASYSFVRRQLNAGVLPQGDAVRAEELVNYFDYDYPLPESKAQPFRPTVNVIDAPWAEGRKLMHIGIKGYDIAPAQKPRSNIVFLLDVSGSMNSPDKLPLVKQSMELLLTTLEPEDTVAVAVYAGAAGMVLEPTPVREKQKILNAMRQLSAGGSTAGAQGIRLAYEMAESGFDKNAVNRVILATDGDFNVGITNQRELQSFIERKRDKGIFLSVLGFGQGNYQDALMQTLAQNGNGVAAYIDTLSEAQKVLVDEATSTLFPIAKDVKMQVEFNPAAVAEYRLIGYETRHLNREDFNNDAVDAGDIGAGHTVTAIYEFTPVESAARQIDNSRYTPAKNTGTDAGSEYAFLKIRYKLPQENVSKLISRPVNRGDDLGSLNSSQSTETGFATAVASFAQILKGGKYTGDFAYDDVIELAQKNRGEDPYGYRTEFIQLVRKAKSATAMQQR